MILYQNNPQSKLAIQINHPKSLFLTLKDDSGKYLNSQLLLRLSNIFERKRCKYWEYFLLLGRSETVSIRISDPNVRVYKINNVDGDDEEENIQSQISPVFTGEKNQINNAEYQLSFLAQVKGLALMTFFVAALRPEEGQNT